jgi:hypothetical protein
MAVTGAIPIQGSTEEWSPPSKYACHKVEIKTWRMNRLVATVYFIPPLISHGQMRKTKKLKMFIPIECSIPKKYEMKVYSNANIEVNNDALTKILYFLNITSSSQYFNGIKK